MLFGMGRVSKHLSVHYVFPVPNFRCPNPDHGVLQFKSKQAADEAVRAMHGKETSLVRE